MPQSIALDEEAAEVLALAFEVSELADALTKYDAVENRAHHALSMSGRNAAEVIAALIAGDEREKQMLAILRGRASSVRAHARALAGRLSGEQEPQAHEPLFADMVPN